LACLSTRDPSASLGAEGRRTFAIPIKGVFYEVGPDVNLAGDGFRATQIHHRYIDTPEYLALARGAMRSMKVETHRPAGGRPARGDVRRRQDRA
jgi:plasmid segregation protein ParM